MRLLSTISGMMAMGLLGLGLDMEAAQAAVFQSILQTGQSVPGNNQPIDDITAIGIDQNQNVAAIVSTQQYVSPFDGNPRGGYSSRFKGVYKFSPNQVPMLIEGGENTSTYGSSATFELTDASISNGKVAFFRSYSSNSRTSTDYGDTQLKIGGGGPLASLLIVNSYPLESRPLTSAATSSLVAANGKPWLLGQRAANPNSPAIAGLLTAAAPNTPITVISSTDPVFGGEPFDPLAPGQLVRADGDRLLLIAKQSTHYSIIEQAGTTAAPRSVAQLPATCGAGISGNNIVLCSQDMTSSNDPYKLFVRFGLTGQFKRINLPINVPITQCSISKKTVIVKVSSNDRDTLYISSVGKPAYPLLKTGDSLDGKVIRQLNLSEKGQSIGNNYIVFLATFTDGSVGLYRGSL